MEYAYFANHKLLSVRIFAHKNLIGTPDIPILRAEFEIVGEYTSIRNGDPETICKCLHPCNNSHPWSKWVAAWELIISPISPWSTSVQVYLHGHYIESVNIDLAMKLARYRCVFYTHTYNELMSGLTVIAGI